MIEIEKQIEAGIAFREVLRKLANNECSNKPGAFISHETAIRLALINE